MIARSAGMAVESAIGAMTRATNTEKAEALQKIKSLLSPKERHVPARPHFGLYIDFLAEKDKTDPNRKNHKKEKDNRVLEKSYPFPYILETSQMNWFGI